MNSFRTAFVLGALGAALASPLLAAEHQVQLLDRSGGQMMAMDPAVLRIAPGDTVRFLPTNKGHNAESIAGMAPDGTPPFKGEMNKELVVAFEKPGVYGYQCKPHYGMGMVGLIIVGDEMPNLETAKSVTHPGKAKQVFAKLFELVRG
jgi:pseudoazurin